MRKTCSTMRHDGSTRIFELRHLEEWSILEPVGGVQVFYKGGSTPIGLAKTAHNPQFASSCVSLVFGF